MEFHEVANLFPLIEGPEFDELVKDIKENGLQQPIWTYKGKIIDGRNRYRACKKADIEPRYQEWDGKGSLVAFAVSLNVKRRHLTSSQLSVIALGVEKQIAEETIAMRNAQLKQGNTVPVPQNFGERGNEAAKEAAKLLNTNHEYVSAAKRIEKEAPELIPHITGGTLTIPDAKVIATLPQERREKVVKKAVQKKEEEGKRVSSAVKEAILEQEIEEVKEKNMLDAAIDKKLTTIDTLTKSKRVIEPEQWWKLGEHLLYCGNSTSDTFKNRAKQAKAAFAFSDPPYNAGVAEQWDKNFEWKHDYLITCAPIVAVTPGISAIHDFMCLTDMPYKWSMSFWLDNGMTRGALGFGNWIYVALFANDSIYRNAQDVWIPKEDRGRVSITKADDDPLKHKGRKPFGVMRHIIELFTNAGEIVIDPFLGTGTTLIACQDTGRICIGAEINPEYCESIMNRWELWTGKEAERWQ